MYGAIDSGDGRNHEADSGVVEFPGYEEWLRKRTEHLDIFLFFRPSLNGVPFPMF